MENRGVIQSVKVSELVVKSQDGSGQLDRFQAPAFSLNVGCDTASGGGERTSVLAEPPALHLLINQLGARVRWYCTRRIQWCETRP